MKAVLEDPVNGFGRLLALELLFLLLLFSLAFHPIKLARDGRQLEQTLTRLLGFNFIPQRTLRLIPRIFLSSLIPFHEYLRRFARQLLHGNHLVDQFFVLDLTLVYYVRLTLLFFANFERRGLHFWTMACCCIVKVLLLDPFPNLIDFKQSQRVLLFVVLRQELLRHIFGHIYMIVLYILLLHEILPLIGSCAMSGF